MFEIGSPHEVRTQLSTSRRVPNVNLASFTAIHTGIHPVTRALEARHACYPQWAAQTPEWGTGTHPRYRPTSAPCLRSTPPLPRPPSQPSNTKRRSGPGARPPQAQYPPPSLSLCEQTTTTLGTPAYCPLIIPASQNGPHTPSQQDHDGAADQPAHLRRCAQPTTPQCVSPPPSRPESRRRDIQPHGPSCTHPLPTIPQSSRPRQQRRQPDHPGRHIKHPSEDVEHLPQHHMRRHLCIADGHGKSSLSPIQPPS